MKVYILTSYGGEYEDKWSNVEGVYLDPRKAEEEKERLEFEMKVMADVPTPFDVCDANLTNEQNDAIYKWSIMVDEAIDFTHCQVKEFEVIE